MNKTWSLSRRLEISLHRSLGDLWIGLYIHKYLIEAGIPFFHISISW